jgi:hypothetical protein
LLTMHISWGLGFLTSPNSIAPAVALHPWAHHYRYMSHLRLVCRSSESTGNRCGRGGHSYLSTPNQSFANNTLIQSLASSGW